MTYKLKFGKLRIASAGLAALALAACGGGGGGYAGGGNPPPPPGGGGGPQCATTLENTFGCNFGALFRAGANTDPAEPDANGIILLSLTTDPVAVP